MADHIPTEHDGRIAAVMFNLGYLPGGDKSITTQSSSTSAAIRSAAMLLKGDGVITILVYTGHEGGTLEAEAIESVLRALPSGQFTTEVIESQPGRQSGPRLFILRRLV